MIRDGLLERDPRRLQYLRSIVCFRRDQWEHRQRSYEEGMDRREANLEATTTTCQSILAESNTLP
jgi:hypothetical protein